MNFQINFLLLAEVFGVLSLASTSEIDSRWLLFPALASLCKVFFVRLLKKKTWGVPEELLLPLLLLLIPLSYLVFKQTGWHPVVVSGHIILLTQSLLFLQVHTERVEGFRSAIVFVMALLSATLSPEFHTGILILAVLVLSILQFFRKTLLNHGNPNLKSPQFGINAIQLGLIFFIVVLSFVFFPLIPRSKIAALFGGSGFGMGSQASTVGFSGEVNLLPSSKWQEANPKVELRIFLPPKTARQSFEYFFPKGLIPMRTLEIFDGQNWLSRNRNSTNDIKKTTEILPSSLLPEIWAEVIREPTSRDNLPSTRNPSRIEFVLGSQDKDGGLLKLNRENQDLSLGLSQRNRVKFLLSKLENEATAEGFSTKPLPGHTPQIFYTKTPNQFADDARVRKLLSEISKFKMSPDSIRDVISNYFRQNNFKWELATQNPDLKGVALLTDFLFNQKKGHCELYATASVLLFRKGGIPARIVTGYLSQFEGGSLVVVYDRQAHAWVEYWDGNKWIAFDPTPPAPMTTFGSSPLTWLAIKWAGLENNLSSAWYREIVGFDPASETQAGVNWSGLFKNLNETLAGSGSEPHGTSAKQSHPNEKFWTVLFFVFGAIGVIFGFYILFQQKAESADLDNFNPKGFLSIKLILVRSRIKILLRRHKVASLKELKKAVQGHEKLQNFVRSYEKERFGA